MQVLISQIRRDNKLQPRANLSSQVIDEYIEEIRRGKDFPPIGLVFDGQSYWPWDGYHRLGAYEGAGATHIEADVTEGTTRDAFKLSLGANASHGQRRSNEDKRRAVTLALEDEEFGKLSDRLIADMCSVSQPFVSALREELSPPKASSGDNGYHLKEKRKGRDGKEYPVKPKKPKAKEVTEAPPTQEAEAAPQEGEGTAESDKKDSSPSRRFDQVGNELPGSLYVTFEGLTRFEEYDSALDKAIRLANQIKESPGGENFSTHKSCLQKLKDARGDVKCIRPYAVCRCKGTGCRNCNQTGYLIKQVHENLARAKA